MAGLRVRAGWTGAVVILPAVGVVWWQPVVHHPVAAVAAAGAYEVLVGGVGFAACVARDLVVRWRARLVDALDRALRRRVSRFGRRYRRFVLAGLRFIDMKGLATVGPFTPELDEVFVDVSLASRPPHLVQAGLLADLPPDVTERRSLAEFLDLPGSVVLAVIGPPGSGKTTLLRHTARQACLHRGCGDRLPVLLHLRDHVTAILANTGVTLAALLRGTLGALAAMEPPGWLEQRLAAGECLVLLDGLDEVARQEDRGLVAAWTERQIRQYSANRYVITSRPHGYHSTGIEGAQVLQIRGFTSAQVSQFVHGWYLAVERHSTGADDACVTARAKEGAGDLLRRLNGAPALYDLTVNPLLLTMIANVHRYRGALPTSRAGLYAEICQVMLWRRQEAKNLAAQLPGEKKEAVLRILAYAMMHRRLADLPRKDVLAEVRPALTRLGREISPTDFVADVSSNGLMVERESGLYCFAHHTFQEYLAAMHIRDKNLAGDLATTVGDPWWRETTLLYAANCDADPIVAACLDSGAIPALALAFDCADQDSDLDKHLREQLDELLNVGTGPATSPDRRRLITGVLVTRYLHQQIRASDGTRFCARPVPVRLYQLFREDTQTPPPDSPPPPADGGDEPATGMRGSDAVAFVRWVNTITSGQPACRLPHQSELEDPTVQRLASTAGDRSGSVWTEPDHATPGSQRPSLWLAPGTQHPHHITTATLTSHVQRDFAKSRPTLAILILLRSNLYAHNLHSYLEHGLGHTFVLALGSDPASDLARALARALARDLDSVHDCDLARDLDRPRTLARALASILALVRALAHDLISARDLARDLTNARDLARDLTNASDLARDLVNDLARDLANAHYLASASDLARDLARALARDLARDIARDLNSALARALDSALPLALALALDVALARDLDLDLDRARVLARDLDRDLAHALTPAHDLILDLILDPVLALDLTLVMGEALSQALTLTTPSTKNRDDITVALSREFTRLTCIAGSGHTVPPDTLAGRLTGALHTQDEHLGARTSSWAVTVATRLHQAAGQVFERRQPLTPGVATSVRLAALSLAAESGSPGQPEVGDTCREIAAGITLLQLRANGDHPATEMILLAID